MRSAPVSAAPEPSPTPSASSAPSPARAAGVLALAVLGISFAAPLIRLSSAPALAVATWRLGCSLVLVGAALLVTGQWRQWRTLPRRDRALAMGAGALLALHFWSWNASLRYTSVAASVSLVNLQPVVIALVSARWLGEAPSRRQWGGILVAVVGALVVALADIPGGWRGIAAALTGGAAGAGARPLLGDALAILGAITAALYYLIGRRLRQQLALWPYVGLVYGAAFCSAVGLAAATGTALGPYPAREWTLFAALAAGPMLLGHTGMNWALGHLPAYVVNLTTLGEPLGATLLAALLPGIAEVPGVGTVIGGALVLAGVLVAARR